MEQNSKISLDFEYKLSPEKKTGFQNLVLSRFPENSVFDISQSRGRDLRLRPSACLRSPQDFRLRPSAYPRKHVRAPGFAENI